MTEQDLIDYEGYCPICECYFDEACKHYDPNTGKQTYSRDEIDEMNQKNLIIGEDDQ